jgi:hypothetical protein
MVFMRSWTLTEREEEAFDRLQSGFANPNKVEHQVWRKIILFTFIVPDTSYLAHGLYSLFVIWMYLEDCDPLPPAQSKIREWLDDIRAFPNTEPVTWKADSANAVPPLAVRDCGEERQQKSELLNLLLFCFRCHHLVILEKLC